MNNLKNIGKIGTIWFAIFSGIWVLIEPLGGMSLIKNYSNNTIFIYLIIATITLLITILFTLFFFNKKNSTKSTDPLRMDLSRAKFDYLEILSGSKKNINLLGLSLPTFSLEAKIDFLKNKVHEGVLIRILLLNPFSPTSKQRPKRIYNISASISETCINTLCILLKLKKYGISEEVNNLLKIRLINIHPSIGIIGNETQIFWSPYLSLYSGAKSPFIIHELGTSDFGNEIQNHFETLWTDYSIEINNDTTLDSLKNFVLNEGFQPVKIDLGLEEKLNLSLGGEKI